MDPNVWYYAKECVTFRSKWRYILARASDSPPRNVAGPRLSVSKPMGENILINTLVIKQFCHCVLSIVNQNIIIRQFCILNSLNK